MSYPIIFFFVGIEEDAARNHRFLGDVITFARKVGACSFLSLGF